MVVCNYCNTRNAILKRPKTSEKICKECFFHQFELEVHETIISNNLFTRGERVAIAASGGKDSTVLAHVLTTLNKRYDYGLNLFLLSIDEGITGYRDDSLESVKRNQQDYAIPLRIVSYKELYGWTMDEIVAEIGLKGNCTFCGVFRRQALDRGAVLLEADKIVTGHNADDMAETVLMNLLRGDIARLERCTSIITGKDGSMPRCKPFKYCYEKEIVMYAYYQKLDYFSTECIYSPNAYRGFAREFLKELEKVKSRSIVDVIRSGEHYKINKELLKDLEEEKSESGKAKPKAKVSKDALIRTTSPASSAAAASSVPSSELERSDSISSNASAAAASVTASTGAKNASRRTAQSLGTCERCNYISSNRICKACVLLEGLNKGKPKVPIGITGTTIGLDSLQITPSPPAADPASSPSLAADAKKKAELSAAMEMAQKKNATSW